MGGFEKNITADYLRRAWEPLREINELSYSLMNLGAAKNAVDIGCGPGLDLAPIARRMPPEGRITGLDISVEMLANAATLVRDENVADRVDLVQANVLKLPFKNGHFDALRAMRLFQVLPEKDCPPSVVFAEMLRVLKPGGRMALVDMDWGSASVDFPDVALERDMTGFFARVCRPAGFSGRKFKGWMIDAGMTDVSIEVFPRVMEKLDDCPLGQWLADEAEKQGCISHDKAQFWMETLREKEKQGALFVCANMLVVAGTRT
jgi:ubiquinone/menaquinone biosynthesis C-methylase UbiE